MAQQNMNMGDIIKMKMLMSVGGDKDSENQGILTMLLIFLISIVEQHFNVKNPVTNYVIGVGYAHIFY